MRFDCSILGEDERGTLRQDNGNMQISETFRVVVPGMENLSVCYSLSLSVSRLVSSAKKRSNKRFGLCDG
jgi:hypothetical protein